MKKIVLFCWILLMFIISACSSKQIAENDIISNDETATANIDSTSIDTIISESTNSEKNVAKNEPLKLEYSEEEKLYRSIYYDLENLDNGDKYEVEHLFLLVKETDILAKKYKNKKLFDFNVDKLLDYDYIQDTDYIDDSHMVVRFKVLSGKQYKLISVHYNIKKIENENGDNYELLDIEKTAVNNLTDDKGNYSVLYKNDKDIFEKLIQKNSNWDGLPLTNEFKEKYNQSDGIFPDIDFDSITIYDKPYTGYTKHKLEVGLSKSGIEKKYLISYKTVVNDIEVYFKIKNFILIDSIEITEISSPDVINNLLISSDNYNKKINNYEYELVVKSLVNLSITTDNKEFKNDWMKDSVDEDYLNSKRNNLYDTNFLGIKELPITDNFKDLLLSKKKRIEAMEYVYNGMNINEQLLSVYISYDYYHQVQYLIRYEVNKEGLIDSYYPVYVDFVNYGHAGNNVPVEFILDENYAHLFNEKFNMWPEDEYNVVDSPMMLVDENLNNRFYQDLLNNIGERPESFEILDTDTSTTKNNYYNSTFDMKLTYSDGIKRYKVNFELNEIMQLVKIEYIDASNQTKNISTNENTYDFIAAINKAKCVTEYPDTATVNDFDSIKIGKYEQDGDEFNGKEDIEWIVLKKKATNFYFYQNMCLIV